MVYVEFGITLRLSKYVYPCNHKNRNILTINDAILFHDINDASTFKEMTMIKPISRLQSFTNDRSLIV